MLIAWLVLAGCAQAALPMLELDDSRPQVDVWSHVTMLSDPDKSMGIQRAMTRMDAFAPPRTAARTLGIRGDAVWLYLPFHVTPRSSGLWVLDIDYPVVNRVDVFLVADGKVVQQQLLGNLVPPGDRLTQARSLTSGLQLQGGGSYALFLRVENSGAMILPITLSRPATFLTRALGEQMLQGLLAGLGVCLLIYSLGQWVTLGESLFLKYAILITGSILFCLLQFGIGAQFLWPGNHWMELHMGGLAALLAATGSFLFIEQVLAGKDMGPMLSRVMKIGAGLTSLSAVLYALDLLTISQVTFIVSTLGLAPSLLGLPGSIRRARRGDVVGYYFLLAWAVYFTTAWVLTEVIKGNLAANFWSLHAFQFGATLDMLIFMRVLGLQTHAMKRAALEATLERDRLHSMAHTDPLTGLPNRRLLHSAIAQATAQRRPDELVAVFMLDLDGFKQVNDRYGHDAGDLLLVEVARRLQANLRSSDLVSRLGGDEFLVLSSGLRAPSQARDLGDKLVKAISEPYLIDGQQLQVGLTIGYALAPSDGRDSAALLKKADAAMYAAKTEGKGRARSASLETGVTPRLEAQP